MQGSGGPGAYNGIWDIRESTGGVAAAPFDCCCDFNNGELVNNSF